MFIKTSPLHLQYRVGCLAPSMFNKDCLGEIIISSF